MSDSSNRVQPSLETLEDRLALSVSAAFINGTLHINGDSNVNNIRIEDYRGTAAVRVFADGAYLQLSSSGSYAVAPSNIIVNAGGHNDTVWTTGIPNYRGSLTMYGGEGNDLLSLASPYVTRYSSLNLYGQGGDDILVGGDGNDYLSGDGPYLFYTGGRDVLIGGRGGDTLEGGANDDLLIAGYTDFDRSHSQLRDVFGWWIRYDRTYEQRAEGLLYNRHYYSGPRLNDISVHTDASVDTLVGGLDRDFFYADPNQDSVPDFARDGQWWAFIWR